MKDTLRTDRPLARPSRYRRDRRSRPPEFGIECARARTPRENRRRMVPDTLGPYRVGHRLGKGGMGEVYLTSNSRLGRQVAIKTILSNAASAPEDLRHALLREARAAAGLSHPSIATIYEVLEQGDENLPGDGVRPGRNTGDADREGPAYRPSTPFDSRRRLPMRWAVRTRAAFITAISNRATSS